MVFKPCEPACSKLVTSTAIMLVLRVGESFAALRYTDQSESRCTFLIVKHFSLEVKDH